jgi:hypothetical protein
MLTTFLHKHSKQYSTTLTYFMHISWQIYLQSSTMLRSSGHRIIEQSIRPRLQSLWEQTILRIKISIHGHKETSWIYSSRDCQLFQLRVSPFFSIIPSVGSSETRNTPIELLKTGSIRRLNPSLSLSQEAFSPVMPSTHPPTSQTSHNHATPH